MDSSTHIKHGAEEVGASTREGQIELFFPHAYGVTRVNLSLKLAVALARWIVRHWTFRCLFGLRVWWRERKAKKLLLKELDL